MNNSSSSSKLSSSSKADRKTVERNRRNEMKHLCSQLHSLVPHQAASSGEPKTLPDQIEEAIQYIKKLQKAVQQSKEKMESLVGMETSKENNNNNNNNNNNSKNKVNSRKRLLLNSPVQIEVNENGKAVEVTLVTSLECQFVFNETIRILHEENAEVFDASYSVIDASVFHTIHAQIGEDAPSHAVARITERLKRFAL